MIHPVRPVHLPQMPAQPASSPSGGSFASAFQDAFQRAEQAQVEAHRQTERLLRGEEQDIHTVALAVQQAELQFEMVQQVRNKFVQAYQEVMRSGL